MVLIGNFRDPVNPVNPVKNYSTRNEPMNSIGQTLKAAREQRQLSAADVAAAIRAKIEIVEAIEADNFAAFPAAIYARGFIKLYAECVGLSPAELLPAYNAPGAQRAPAPPIPPPAPLPQPPPPKPRPARTRKPETPAAAPRKARAWSWPRFNYTAVLSRIRLPRFRIPRIPLAQIQLPVETWQTILTVAGAGVLVVAALAGLVWSSRGKSDLTPPPACRWIQEPPAPYVGPEFKGE